MGWRWRWWIWMMSWRQGEEACRGKTSARLGLGLGCRIYPKSHHYLSKVDTDPGGKFKTNAKNGKRRQPQRHLSRFLQMSNVVQLLRIHRRRRFLRHQIRYRRREILGLLCIESTIVSSKYPIWPSPSTTVMVKTLKPPFPSTKIDQLEIWHQQLPQAAKIALCLHSPHPIQDIRFPLCTPPNLSCPHGTTASASRPETRSGYESLLQILTVMVSRPREEVGRAREGGDEGNRKSRNGRVFVFGGIQKEKMESFGKNCQRLRGVLIRSGYGIWCLRQTYDATSPSFIVVSQVLKRLCWLSQRYYLPQLIITVKPTGTRSKFARMMKQALHEFENKYRVSVKHPTTCWQQIVRLHERSFFSGLKPTLQARWEKSFF